MAETVDDAGLRARAMAVGEALCERGWMLCAAESCTGGWVAKVCTDIPGSSHWFDRGFVTYTNDAKQDLLGVPAACLQEHGAVSGETVRAMVDGAMARSRAQVAVAISGIAGPGGGSAEKPVGTVWLAWGHGEARVVERASFDGDREQVRRQAVARALDGVLRGLTGA